MVVRPENNLSETYFYLVLSNKNKTRKVKCFIKSKDSRNNSLYFIAVEKMFLWATWINGAIQNAFHHQTCHYHNWSFYIPYFQNWCLQFCNESHPHLFSPFPTPLKRNLVNKNYDVQNFEIVRWDGNKFCPLTIFPSDLHHGKKHRKMAEIGLRISFAIQGACALNWVNSVMKVALSIQSFRTELKALNWEHSRQANLDLYFLGYGRAILYHVNVSTNFHFAGTTVEQQFFIWTVEG